MNIIRELPTYKNLPPKPDRYSLEDFLNYDKLVANTELLNSIELLRKGTNPMTMKKIKIHGELWERLNNEYVRSIGISKLTDVTNIDKFMNEFRNISVKRDSYIRATNKLIKNYNIECREVHKYNNELKNIYDQIKSSDKVDSNCYGSEHDKK